MSDKDVELGDQAFALFTGSEQDRKDIIAIHRAYLDANTNNLNAAELRKIWSNHPSCVFFNGTGYNYSIFPRSPKGSGTNNAQRDAWEAV